MKFWLTIFLVLTFFAVNIAPEVAYAKQSKVEKTKTKKSSKAKKSAKSKKAGKKQAKSSKSKKSKASKRSRARKYAAPTEVYSPKYAEFLVDGDSGQILHQEDANSLRYPASLTKMMTIYLAFEQLKAGHLRMGSDLRVSAYAASMPKTNLSLSPGDDITVKEAILALVIHSANDAAVVLAENIAGDEDSFATLMTQRARQLGMKSTRFVNACGLHDPRQVTTAKDMALLAIALKKHYPEYYSMFSRTEFTYNGRNYQSHNRVTRSYSGAEGLKTGYVRASGFNLVTSATRYEGNLVGVVMGGRTAAGRDQRMKDLLDAGFDRLAQVKKKDRYAHHSSSETLDFASLDGNSSLEALAPTSGNKNEEIAETSESEIISPIKKRSERVDQVKPAAEIAPKVASQEPKHFAADFVPAPKVKPKKLASLR